MQKELNPQDVANPAGNNTTNNFDEKFKKGPVPKMTPEEEEELKRKNQEFMQKDIEFMRLKHEYTKLQIEGYEHAVLLGQMMPSQVPGLLGLKLMREDLETQAFLGQVKAGIEQGMREEEEKKKQAESKSQIITDK